MQRLGPEWVNASNLSNSPELNKTKLKYHLLLEHQAYL
jgi:hypothetical protein